MDKIEFTLEYDGRAIETGFLSPNDFRIGILNPETGNHSVLDVSFEASLFLQSGQLANQYTVADISTSVRFGEVIQKRTPLRLTLNQPHKEK